MEWLWPVLVTAGLGVAGAGILWVSRAATRSKQRDRIVEFLEANYSGKGGAPQYASVRMISTKCNLTEEEVRSLCSREKRMRRSVGEQPDMWGLISVVGPATVRRRD